MTALQKLSIARIVGRLPYCMVPDLQVDFGFPDGMLVAVHPQLPPLAISTLGEVSYVVSQVRVFEGVKIVRSKPTKKKP